MVKNFFERGIGSVLVAVGLALFVRWTLIEAYVIPSGSMLPTLFVNDHIFVNKWAYGVRWPFSQKWIVRWSNPKPGEVVIFRYPADPSLFYVKRVIAGPGDQVLYESGQIYLNGEVLPQSLPQGGLKSDYDWLRDQDFPSDYLTGGVKNYIHWQEELGEVKYSILNRRGSGEGLVFGPFDIPDGRYFVMGDNRDNSRDSRLWGGDRGGQRFVPEDLIVGRVWIVWLSCEQRLSFASFLCDPLAIRWNRFFHHIR